MKSRTWKYLLVMAVMAVFALVGAESYQAPNQSFANLDVLIDSELKDGWRVVREPDVAGPYQRSQNKQYVGRGSVASIAYNSNGGPTIVKLPARDDVEQLIVPLGAVDGRITVVVFER